MCSAAILDGLKVTDWNGGASRDRTDDLIVANDALSQLSYSPKHRGKNYWNDFTSAGPSHKIGQRPVSVQGHYPKSARQHEKTGPA